MEDPMLALLITGVLLAAPLPTQDPPPQAPAAQEPVTLEDVTVTGRPLDAMIRNFVSEVAEPNRGRGLARWDDQICVGVVNLRAETAQYLADRISTVAEDVGLTPGAPGCSPTLLVVATDDGEALARSMVETRRRAFRMGGAGMDRGGDALADFVETDRPVRWWQMAMPVDSETGQRATRIPGDCEGMACAGGNGSVMAFAPAIGVFAASRLRTQIVDRLIRTIVVVDVDDVAELSILQLADYIAMVSLAQIDPEADTSGYASVLNVFDNPGAADGLMDWDRAYLDGLYASEGNAISRKANRQEIVSAIHDAHEDLRAREPAEEEPVGDGAGR